MIFDLEKLPVIPLDDNPERWSRIAQFARLLEIECADLGDEEDAWRCLMRNGVSPGEAFQLSPDAIRRARENMGSAR